MGSTAAKIMRVFGDFKPHSTRDVIRLTGLDSGVVRKCIDRLWRNGRILRTRESILEHKGLFR
jgi:DNA-binding MarR family transcriptional regulator